MKRLSLLLPIVFFVGCQFDNTSLQQTSCELDEPCPEDFTCINNRCVPGTDVVFDTAVATDTSESDGTEQVCGNETCGEGEDCCGFVCISVDTDVDNCGACGNVCATDESCVDGECTCGNSACNLGERCCPSGGNRSCINTQVDVTNCGACGETCASEELCVRGLCVCESTGGTQQCGEDDTCCPGAGCRNLDTDPLHCGACGVVCGAGESCVSGACECGSTTGGTASGAACGSGTSCCGDPASCVVDTPADPNPQCSCGGVTCQAGQACCPINTSEGTVEACVLLAQDPRNCGVCGTACGAGQACQGGSCVVFCPIGQIACGLKCVDPLNDPQYCGATTCTNGTVCGAGEVCSNGSCSNQCGAGSLYCNSRCVDPQNDPAYCGATTCSNGTTCTASQLCSGGSCLERCGVGKLFCNGSCIDPSIDPSRCGATNCTNGDVCVSGETCSSGSCSCATGFASCDGNPANGCEAYLPLDDDNCGSCGTDCGIGGQCCSGGCRNILTSAQNCGACGNACSSGEQCCSGACAVSCGGGGCTAGDGTEASCAGLSCKAILDGGHSTGDGVYWVQPGTDPAIQVHCDMSSDGGGWTLLMRIEGTSSIHVLSNVAEGSSPCEPSSVACKLSTDTITDFIGHTGTQVFKIEPDDSTQLSWYVRANLDTQVWPTSLETGSNQSSLAASPTTSWVMTSYQSIAAAQAGTGGSVGSLAIGGHYFPTPYPAAQIFFRGGTQGLRTNSTWANTGFKNEESGTLWVQ